MAETRTTKCSSAPVTYSISPRYEQLFQTIQSRFQTTNLGEDRWYILTISTLAAGPDPESADQLYQYLLVHQQARYCTSSARQALVRRLREALVKCVPIVGVCKPLEAILAISKVEKDEDKDYSCTRENWQCDAANHDRGVQWFSKLYAQNAESTLGLFEAHRDFAWISMEITYGLYLSDRQVLDDVDTQMVVLPAIMSQDLKNETHWHIRGTRRIGVSKADVEVVCECVRMVADFYGVELHKVPSVDAVERDV